jgi:hypothetical protein
VDPSTTTRKRLTQLFTEERGEDTPAVKAPEVSVFIVTV